MADFFHMGGYAGYIWPAYGIAALVVGALSLSTWKKLKRAGNLLKESTSFKDKNL